jgi:hypothetical protein
MKRILIHEFIAWGWDMFGARSTTAKFALAAAAVTLSHNHDVRAQAPAVMSPMSSVWRPGSVIAEKPPEKDVPLIPKGRPLPGRVMTAPISNQVGRANSPILPTRPDLQWVPDVKPENILTMKRR